MIKFEKLTANRRRLTVVKNRKVTELSRQRRVLERIESRRMDEGLRRNRENFVSLVCGRPIGHSQLSKSLGYLAKTIDTILHELPPPFGRSQVLSPLYLPFLTRSLIEVSFTALVGRGDPFRILTIGTAQSNEAYDPGVPSALAFRWQGDVFPIEAPKAELWGVKAKISDVSRALLGDYQEKLLWRPAFEKFIDLANQRQNQKNWTAELALVDPNSFLPRYRSSASTVFSTSSKGVHHEYVVAPETYFDASTLQVMLDDCLKVVLSFAVIANFCDHYSFRIPENEAYEIFESLQQ